MNLVRWSRVVGLALAAACEVPTAPPLPNGTWRFAPPPVYDRWWAMTQECSGRSSSLADVRWYFLPGARSVVVAGSEYDGYWYGGSLNRIVLAEEAVLDGPLVRHEMLHELTGTGGHPRAEFLQRCGGVVSCDGRCLEDAGELPPADPGVTRVGPEMLELDVTVYPEPPSRAQYGGHFTVTVTARNPLPHPVVVTLPPPGDAGPGVSFEYRLEFGGVVTFNDRAWDEGVTRFAAGEVKRRVFDFYMIDAVGVRGDGGLGPGTYRFRGAYGERWAPVAATITIPAP